MTNRTHQRVLAVEGDGELRTQRRLIRNNRGTDALFEALVVHRIQVLRHLFRLNRLTVVLESHYSTKSPYLKQLGLL